MKKDNQITSLNLFVFFFILGTFLGCLVAIKRFLTGSLAIKQISEGSYVFYRNGDIASWGVFIKLILGLIVIAFLFGLACTIFVIYCSRSENEN